MAAEFVPGSEGSHFDKGLAPAGKLADFGDGTFFQVEERNNEAILRRKNVEQLLHDLPCAGCILRCVRALCPDKEIDPIPLGFAEIGPTPLGTTLFRAKGIEAGGDSEARDPMLEGNTVTSFILIHAGKHFQKHLLREILLEHPPGQMGADDLHHQRIEVFDECAGCFIISRPDCVEAGGHIEHGLGSHGGNVAAIRICNAE